MSTRLVLFEDERWRDLRPLTDVVAVPALRFGGATLGERLARATRMTPLAVLVRAALAEPVLPAGPALDPADDVLALNAAAQPGEWLTALHAHAAPARFVTGGRIAAARLPAEIAAPGIAAGGDFERFLRELDAPEYPCDARLLQWPWQLVEWNAAAIADDLAGVPAERAGEVHASAVLLEPARIAIGRNAVIDPLVVLDARGGPIRIGVNARIAPHTVVIGPCVVGDGTQLLGGVIGRSTIGPECRLAGEIEECVWQGWANKRHHGFVGHSVIGEWVNLGALTTTSDLKNNYGAVRVRVDGRDVDSGATKVGAAIGAHVKTGIGTLLPTGAVVGVGANLFGGGAFAPKSVPAFGWWDGERMIEHRLESFLGTARIAMSRRGRELTPELARRLEALFAATAKERAGG